MLTSSKNQYTLVYNFSYLSVTRKKSRDKKRSVDLIGGEKVHAPFQMPFQFLLTFFYVFFCSKNKFLLKIIILIAYNVQEKTTKKKINKTILLENSKKNYQVFDNYYITQ